MKWKNALPGWAIIRMPGRPTAAFGHDVRKPGREIRRETAGRGKAYKKFGYLGVQKRSLFARAIDASSK
jgi:hypothetical protein